MGHKSLLGVKRMRYNPQDIVPGIYKKVKLCSESRGARPNQVGKKYQSFSNFPNNVLYFNCVSTKEVIHPTQKPTALFEYLIKTYTNKGDLVLDNCIGSGTTAIACLNTKRNYIGIEKEGKYFNICRQRIKSNPESLRWFFNEEEPKNENF